MKKIAKLFTVALCAFGLFGISNTASAKTKHVNASNVAVMHKSGKYHFNGYSKKTFIKYSPKQSANDVDANPIKVSKIKYQIAEMHNTQKDTATDTNLPIPDDAHVKKGQTTYYLFITGTVKNTSSKKFTYNGLLGGQSAVLPDNTQVEITGLSSSDNTRNDYQPNATQKTGTSILYLGTKKIKSGTLKLETGESMDAKTYNGGTDTQMINLQVK